MGQEKNTIEKLLEDEQLPAFEQVPKELRKFELKPSAEALAGAKVNWEEKREFTRAEIDSSIVLAFASEGQFAKHYVENISLGGLFVKTSHRPGLGAVLPIEFSVNGEKNTNRIFRLHGKVCRETDRGLGLQFTNLTPEIRKELESFVKDALPEGSSVLNQVKKAAVERLEQAREEKSERKLKQMKVIKTSVLIGSLLIFNLILGSRVIKTTTTSQTRVVVNTISIKDRNVPVENIRSLSRDDAGNVIFALEGGDSVVISLKDLQIDQLPSDIQHSVTLIQSIPVKKTLRKTKNPPRHFSSTDSND